MSTELSLSDWLSQEPLLSEIKTNDDGSRYLPIEVIKPKLDYLCNIGWETKNFKHSYFNLPDRTLCCTGSVELTISYSSYMIGSPVNIIDRTITGSATFDINRYYPNFNLGAICLSLCIVNASQNISKFFGKDLNKGLLTIPSIKEIKVTPIDDKMINTLKSIGKKKL